MISDHGEIVPARESASGDRGGVESAGRAWVGRRSGVVVGLLCLLMMVAHVVAGLRAVSGKSATNDEPLHLVSGVVINAWGDFRVNPEDPPLWKRFAAWGITPETAWGKGMGRETPDWEKMLDPISRRHWDYSVDALYRTPGVDADGALMSARRRMALVSAGLGLLTAWLAWSVVSLTGCRSGAGCAALVSAALFAADPNFLGHGMLVKNDVALALAGLALAASGWALGRAVTVTALFAAGLACAAAVTVKFSGVAFPVFLGVTLLARAMFFGRWRFFGREAVGRGSKTVLAVGIMLFVAVVGYGGLWAAYGFRGSATPDGRDLELDSILLATARVRAGVASATPQTSRASLGVSSAEDERLALERPGLMVSAATFLHDRRWVPRPWISGLLYTYHSAVARPGFLMGEVSLYGWWWYFPATMALKSPVGLGVAVCVAMGATAVWVGRRRRTVLVGLFDALRTPGPIWTVVALSVLPALYMGVAMTSSLNLGLRHVLVVYPFVHVAVGVAAGVLWARRSRLRWVMCGAVMAVVVESAKAYPNYVAFFNVPARGYGPEKLLGDSNLDWGQDLPLLAEWQKKNPNSTLFLAFQGTADPSYYGIRYTLLPGGYTYGRVRASVPEGAGTIAVGATALQGIYAEDVTRAYLAPLGRVRPKEILGGTIYLFDRPGPKPRPTTAATKTP